MRLFNDLINENSNVKTIYVYFEPGQSGWGAMPMITVSETPERFPGLYSDLYTKKAWIYRFKSNMSQKDCYDFFMKNKDIVGKPDFEKLFELKDDFKVIELGKDEDYKKIENICKNL